MIQKSKLSKMWVSVKSIIFINKLKSIIKNINLPSITSHTTPNTKNTN